MNKLEEQVIESIKRTNAGRLLNVNTWGVSDAEREIAAATAKICLEIAERAWGLGWCRGHNDGIGYQDDSSFEDFKKELL